MPCSTCLLQQSYEVSCAAKHHWLVAFTTAQVKRREKSSRMHSAAAQYMVCRMVSKFHLCSMHIYSKCVDICSCIYVLHVWDHGIVSHEMVTPTKTTAHQLVIIKWMHPDWQEHTYDNVSLLWCILHGCCVLQTWRSRRPGPGSWVPMGGTHHLSPSCQHQGTRCTLEEHSTGKKERQRVGQMAGWLGERWRWVQNGNLRG